MKLKIEIIVTSDSYASVAASTVTIEAERVTAAVVKAFSDVAAQSVGETLSAVDKKAADKIPERTSSEAISESL